MLSYGVARQSHPWYKRAIVNQFALAVNRCLTSFVGPQACNLRVALSSDAKGIEKLFREEGVRRSWDVQSVIDMDLPYFDIAAISEGKVIGAARVVCGDSGSFPIKKDSAWPNLQISKHSAEVAMAVVDPAYRGDTNVIMSVYAFLYWVLHEMDITHV